MEVFISTAKDIDTLVFLRLDYLEKLGNVIDEPTKESMTKDLKKYFATAIQEDRFIGVWTQEGDKITSMGFLCMNSYPANRHFTNGITGTILNVLTYEEYRRKGHGKKVIETIVAEAKKRDATAVDVWSTKEGEVLYESVGFKIPPHLTAMRILI